MMSEISRRDVLRNGVIVSAGCVLHRSALASVEAHLGAADGAQQPGSVQVAREIDMAPREHLLFDFDWRFCQGHASDPARDLGFGSGQTDFAKTGDFKFAKPDYDDSKWRALNLPHDWAVELPFVDDLSLRLHGYKPLGRAFPETSIGWYRRTFDIPASDEGRRIYVDFDGAYRSAMVFCNGVYVGRNESGYVPFRFDLTDFLNYGEKNAIAVRVDASLREGWFYEGAGIYRHVWLTKVDPLHLGQWDTVVRTEVKDRDAILNLSTIVENSAGKEDDCLVHWRILDSAGRVVAIAESPSAKVEAHSRQPFCGYYDRDLAHFFDVVGFNYNLPSTAVRLFFERIA